MLANDGTGFGELVRQWRRERNLTQEMLAHRADLSTRHLSFLETGRSRPSLTSVMRIAEALELSRSQQAVLLSSTGVEASRPEPEQQMFELLFETAVAIEEAANPSAMVAVAAPALWRLGYDRFFLGTIAASREELTFDEPATFPSSWVRSYVDHSNARYDPLIAEACDGRTSFFWTDVLPGRNLPEPARRMFATAEGDGTRSGFVAALPAPRGEYRIMSMMGPGRAEETAALRLALRTVGWAAIHKLAEFREAPAGVPVNRRDLPCPRPIEQG